jgi:phosphatidylglycerophosphate synthase
LFVGGKEQGGGLVQYLLPKFQDAAPFRCYTWHMQDTSTRRPIGVRTHMLSIAAAKWLTARGIKPNWISWASIGFAGISALSFFVAGALTDFGRSFFLLLAILGIVARLVANMMDGMVAVEGGLGEADGPVWNEIPDRVSDALIFVGAGAGLAIADSGPEALGWLAAILAIICAYVRELGTQLLANKGFGPDFSGPFAKQQRMAAIGLGAFVGMFEGLWGWDFMAINLALWLVIAGTTLTIVLRTRTLIARLKAPAA